MEGIFDAYMVENGGFLTTADLAYESAEVIFDNKFAHLEYDYEKLMMEHDEHLKMIELKILTENGTAEDYEYLIVQEAEAVKTESKGIFGGLLQVIANIFKAISKLLFGEDFNATLGEKEVKVKLDYDPYKLMQEYDETEEALKKAAHGNMNPLKALLASASTIGATTGLWFKVGKPFVKKLGKYADEKAAQMIELQQGVDGANLSDEDSKAAKSGISRLKNLASRISSCIAAIPKALRNDPEFQKTLKDADDRADAEAEADANADAEAKAAAKAAKADAKAAKKEQRAADKAAKNEEKAANKELKLQGFNPKMKEYIEEIKNDTRDDDLIANEITKCEAKIAKQKKIRKAASPLRGFTDPSVDTRARGILKTARGLVKSGVDAMGRKVKGDYIGNSPEYQRSIDLKNTREQATKAINALEARVRYDKAVLHYRQRQKSIHDLETYVSNMQLNNFDFDHRPVTDLINECAEDIFEGMLDIDMFLTDNDISEELIKEYGYNPLDEDFDTLVEEAFSLD